MRVHTRTSRFFQNKKNRYILGKTIDHVSRNFYRRTDRKCDHDLLHGRSEGPRHRPAVLWADGRDNSFGCFVTNFTLALVWWGCSVWVWFFSVALREHRRRADVGCSVGGRRSATQKIFRGISEPLALSMVLTGLYVFIAGLAHSTCWKTSVVGCNRLWAAMQAVSVCSGRLGPRERVSSKCQSRIGPFYSMRFGWRW